MVFLEPDPFLNELNKLYERNKSSTGPARTVWITCKRSALQGPKKKGAPAAAGDAPAEADYKCLIRATDGKKKISTAVSVKEVARFQTAYATVLKAHMDALKKKEKRDKKKTGNKPSVKRELT
ncbi:signal recognition particle 14kDa family protein [Klebsormidium nitens]|uniref:Signal recognition particle 14 kDa protein n=1 Tax=Klebsormidium nitens TaxID=105231 RepID=A0A1Y1ID43_KLENI|nr:signal recognition particle 14kDa family protein [Klebsormidium nitens]|eukprot:GAQ88874.1 signal recognition particle 14kDa family protein [Klebsormidium nitens]